MKPSTSYDFDHFSEGSRREELERLQRQASVLLGRELALLEGLGVRPGCQVLEVGCGPGFLAGAIADRVAPGRVVGVDSSTELLQVAQQVVQPKHSNLSFHEGSAYRTGLAEGDFDFIYNRFLFQHLDRPLAALEEAGRLLRPGGRVCVLDVDDGWMSLHPANPHFDELIGLAGRLQAERGGDRQVGRKLPGLLQRAGFCSVSVQVQAVSSLELGLEAFISMSMRHKAMQVGGARAQELIEAMQGEIDRSAGREPVVGIAGIFVVSGTK